MSGRVRAADDVVIVGGASGHVAEEECVGHGFVLADV